MYTASYAQESIPFTSDQWQFTGSHTLETYLGKEGVRLYNSSAYLPNVSFKNGIIEYDVALSTQRGFGGVHFRIQDEGNYEEYYMRSHQSGNPDAMQYSPVYNGIAAWQLYHGDGYGGAFRYAFNRWMHVKLVFPRMKWKYTLMIWKYLFCIPSILSEHLKVDI